MSAWVLPDHIADVLPSQARHIEELRRDLLDMARSYGYELVIPPLVEHLESLLTGAGEKLDLQTFKLVDQLSGRTLGIRADTTPQVARIDSHLLNREGVTRLCYCGPILHANPSGPQASREPLQFGAEIYGHSGLEADLEVLLLAFDCLDKTKVNGLSVDLGDARIVSSLLEGRNLSKESISRIHNSLSCKDKIELERCTSELPSNIRKNLIDLLDLYGDVSILEKAKVLLPPYPLITQALNELFWLANHFNRKNLTIDLAELRGYSYYTGAFFSIYASGANDALVKGGRYNDAGSMFGRKRSAAGFSLDIKAIVDVLPANPLRTVIRAAWGEQDDLRAAINVLRARGETVVCSMPGHDNEVDEFQCDRELIQVNKQWIVKAI